ncbi:hypothetical protein EUA04_07855 [Mycolicibacterium obuense]|uniref:Uncharacterized protein n=1 Tax=Mycolicibacterium obuense TaxID=1807 RepID=A0A4R5XAH2_9MYCO|nr:hypothetical protein [Mycolicibacterium obuense]TDL09862.1 hypothetical protein EUA04_07855 [Mycolicibacterium obuense]
MPPNLAPDPVPDWLELAAAWATVIGVLGVLIALLALGAELHKARVERLERSEQAAEDQKRHEAQIAALQRAEDERLAAQARKILFSVVNASAVIPNLFHVRLDNFGTERVSGLTVEVLAKNAAGEIVSDGCRVADQTTVGQAIAELMVPEITKTFDIVSARYKEFLQLVRDGSIELGADPAQMQAYTDEMASALDIDAAKAELMKEQVKHVIAAQLYQEWPYALAPGQFAVMPYITSSADYSLRVDLQFDDSNYTWRRVDGGRPEIVSTFALPEKNSNALPISQVTSIRTWYKPATWFSARTRRLQSSID